jgi:hypothetical protein
VTFNVHLVISGASDSGECATIEGTVREARMMRIAVSTARVHVYIYSLLSLLLVFQSVINV